MSDPTTVSTVGTYRQVDVNGAAGWVNDEAAYSVVWPLGDDTWAQAVNAESAAEALAFARSLEFIDESNWAARYHLDDPATVFADPTRQPPTATEPSAPAPSGEGDDPATFERVDATLIGRAPAANSNANEIDQGSLDGIRVGMPVFNNAGLVGKVQTVTDNTSIVLLATSPDFEVSAQIIGRDDPSRVVVGVLTGQGAGQPLRFSAPAQQWITPIALGDLAHTIGGANSLAPADIPIGTATAVTHPTPERPDTLEVDIQPITTINDVATVQVILHRPANE